MRASPQTLLLTSVLAAVIAAPCFVGVRNAYAQSSAQGAPLTPYPACTNKPTSQDSEAAHSAYLLGKRFFEESDYGSASHNFIDAFKLDCTKPELLLNIARANELLGNRAEAVHALETYLQRSQSMSADEKLQLQRRIDNLKAAIAAQTAASQPRTVVVTPAPVAPTPATPAPDAPTAPAPLPPPLVLLVPRMPGRQVVAGSYAHGRACRPKQVAPAPGRRPCRRSPGQTSRALRG